MRVGFYTLGCKVNQYETEAMKEKFMAAGYEVVGHAGEGSADGESAAADAALNASADVYVINTCTVTNMADRKSRQFISRAKKLNPNAIIAVVGCYAQVDPEAVSQIEGVDIVLGTNEKSNIVEKIALYVENSVRSDDASENGHSSDAGHGSETEKIVDVLDRSDLQDYHSDGIITAMESRTRAYIKIQEGCDRFCSYCIIPYARGPVRSRAEDEIVEEARGLVEAGFKEIVLTGINTALYGAEHSGGDVPPIRKLIDRIAEIPGDFRIRLSSLEPNVMKAEDVLAIVGADKLCHHLHLSIQSGSNKILEAMNRRYTREEYIDIVHALHKFDTNFAVTTDIIVGFPGETEEDFQDSIDLVKTAGLARVHVFPYSPRRGTVAAEMKNQVPSEEKKRRAKTLSEVADEVAGKFHENCKNAIIKGLFEEVKGGVMTGYTDNYIRIYADAREEFLNKLIDVKLQENYRDGMKAEIL